MTTKMKPVALVVEDRPEIAAIWKNNLVPLDMDIREAASLEDAKLLAWKIPPPDLILLDLRLTDSEATNTLLNIKELKRNNPQAVVIVISGFLTDELATLAIAQGASAVREKLEMQRQEDLWKTITEALESTPTRTKDALSFVGELIHKLTKRLA